MKKRMAIVLGLMLTNSLVEAAWYEKNPDHCPSIGFNIDGATGSGTGKIISSGVAFEQDIESTLLDLTADARIPVSDSLSFNAAIGIAGVTGEAKETNFLDQQESEEGVFHFNVGVRFYIH